MDKPTINNVIAIYYDNENKTMQITLRDKNTTSLKAYRFGRINSDDKCICKDAVAPYYFAEFLADISNRKVIHTQEANGRCDAYYLIPPEFETKYKNKPLPPPSTWPWPSTNS